MKTKDVMIIIALDIAVMILMYLLGSFSQAAFKITEWSSDARIVVATLIGFIVAFLSVGLTVVILDSKRQ